MKRLLLELAAALLFAWFAASLDRGANTAGAAEPAEPDVQTSSVEGQEAPREIDQVAAELS